MVDRVATGLAFLPVIRISPFLSAPYYFSMTVLLLAEHCEWSLQLVAGLSPPSHVFWLGSVRVRLMVDRVATGLAFLPVIRISLFLSAPYYFSITMLLLAEHCGWSLQLVAGLSPPNHVFCLGSVRVRLMVDRVATGLAFLPVIRISPFLSAPYYFSITMLLLAEHCGWSLRTFKGRIALYDVGGAL